MNAVPRVWEGVSGGMWMMMGGWWKSSFSEAKAEQRAHSHSMLQPGMKQLHHWYGLTRWEPALEQQCWAASVQHCSELTNPGYKAYGCGRANKAHMQPFHLAAWKASSSFKLSLAQTWSKDGFIARQICGKLGSSLGKERVLLLCSQIAS